MLLSYTTLYALYALSSGLLFNSLILLSRYVKQLKEPPLDEDFINLLKEKNDLIEVSDRAQSEILALKSSVQQVEQELRKTEESLKRKSEELDNIRQAAGVSDGGAPANPA